MPLRSDRQQQRHGERGDQHETPGGLLRQYIADPEDAQTNRDCQSDEE